MSIFKDLKPRTKDEIIQWARDNFSLRDLENVCENEVAREVRNLSIRFSMYMEMLSDSQKQATAIAMLSLLISVCAVILSSAIAILR